MKIENLTIGSDPELFLETPDGEVVSCIGFCSGTKEKPELISKDGHAIQIDGIALEYNLPPSKTKEELINNINFIKDYTINTIAKPKGLVISKKVSEEILDKHLPPEARILGCSASFCAWTESVNGSPDGKSNWRSVGGHVHLGYNNPTMETSIEIIKAFDLFLTVPSILIDTDTNRRKLYGRAGEFRFTSFGCEARCLSNFWIHNNELIGWVYDQLQLMVNFINLNNTIDKKTSEKIVECINTQNKELAQQLINQYNLICVE
tara:strand:- start:2744 stop:3532 length:789 start_codon:yes stop_codon:yes gene_type:complete